MVRVIILSSVLVWIAGCATNATNPSQGFRINTTSRVIDNPSGLMQAVAQGHETRLRERIISGDSVNAVFKEDTPLRIALINERVRIAQILLRAGAKPDASLNKEQASALMLASRHGLNSIVTQLIKQGVDIDYENASGNSALVEAAMRGHLTTVNILIAAGVNVDVFPNGRSLLMHMVADNNMLIVKPLIEAGVDVNYMDANGESALSVARENNFHDLDLLLVQGGARL